MAIGAAAFVTLAIAGNLLWLISIRFAPDKATVVRPDGPLVWRAARGPRRSWRARR